MKNSLRYLKLWQKKRSEMPLDANPQADWVQMASLLDKHLPVSNTPTGGNAAPSKGFTLFKMMLIGLSAAAMTYVVSYVVKTNSRKHQAQHTGVVVVSKADSISRATADSVVAKSDSPGASTLGGKNDTSTPRAESSKVTIKAVNKNDSLAGVTAPAGTSSAATKAGDIKAGNSIKTGSGKGSAALSGSVAGKSIIASSKLSGSSNSHFAGLARNSHQIPTNGALTHTSNKNNKTGLNNKTNLQNGVSRTTSLHSPGHNGVPSGGITTDDRSKITMRGTAHGGASANVGSRMQGDDSHQNFEALQATPPTPVFTARGRDNSLTVVNSHSAVKPQSTVANKTKDTQKGKKVKDAKPSKPGNPLNINWGLLIGFNSAGSFTPKAQNSNFYGSMPVDPFFGLFAAYNLNDNWSIGLQVRALNPQKISGSYTHANGSNVDSNQMITVSDSRKAYTVDIPLQVIYKVNNNLSFKAGPVFSIPVKAMGGSATLLPAAIKTDTAYYKGIIRQIDSVKYQPKFNYGFSAGASYQFNRFIFSVDYLKNLGGYQVNSGFGNYKSHNGTLQFTIGFRLK